MINREMKTVSLRAYTTSTDAYGQLHKGSPTTTNIQMVIKPLSIELSNDINFVDVTDIGLTQCKNIIAGNEIADGTNIYLVIKVINSSRLNQVYMKLCH